MSKVWRTTRAFNPLVHDNHHLWLDLNVLSLIGMQIFITGWWLCPELYLRRPFQSNSSSRLDSLLEAKAKQGVQVKAFCQSFDDDLLCSPLGLLQSIDYFNYADLHSSLQGGFYCFENQ